MSGQPNLIQILQDYYANQLAQLMNVKPQGGGQGQVQEQREQSPAGRQLTTEEELLLKMYDEFATTSEGQALATGLGKFARFVQGKVAAQGQVAKPTE